MQLRDVAETDDRFGDRRDAVDDALQSVSATSTEDRIDGRGLERFDKVR